MTTKDLDHSDTYKSHLLLLHASLVVFREKN